jgi:hypothetical protein
MVREALTKKIRALHLSKDLKEVSEPPNYLQKQHFRLKEQKVQIPKEGIHLGY